MILCTLRRTRAGQGGTGEVFKLQRRNRFRVHGGGENPILEMATTGGRGSGWPTNTGTTSALEKKIISYSFLLPGKTKGKILNSRERGDRG